MVFRLTVCAAAMLRRAVKRSVVGTAAADDDDDDGCPSLADCVAAGIIIIIIDNRGLNARWCLTPFLLSLPTAAYLGQRCLTPAGLSHTTAQCHLTILGEAVLFCLNHPSFRTPGS